MNQSYLKNNLNINKMKKKCMLAAVAAIVAVSVTVGYNTQTKRSVQSDLAIANIEALTYDEWGYDHGCLDNGDGCMLITYSQWYPNLLPKDM